MRNSKIIAIIPARGGSKGVPKKNARILAGKPLIVHSIEHAKQSKYIERIIISTDDGEIEKISLNAGAEVIIRPKEISDDKSPSEDALIHVIKTIQNKEKITPEIIVFLQATSPLRNPDDIDNAIELFFKMDADSLLSVVPFHHFIWKSNGNSFTAYNYDPFHRKMRQDTTPEYMENGSIYICKSNILLSTSNRLGGKIEKYLMKSHQSFEIDTEDDFWLCEQVLNRNKGTLFKKNLPDNIELIILDFDGVFTDNRVIISDTGSESVICNRSDGYGIEMLKKSGYEIIVISKEMNPVVEFRCKKLGIPVIQGCNDKLEILVSTLHQKSCKPENVIYIGNDVNDIECMNYVGCAISPADAHPRIQSVSKIVLKNKGGNGAIREFADCLLERKGDQCYL